MTKLIPRSLVFDCWTPICWSRLVLKIQHQEQFRRHCELESCFFHICSFATWAPGWLVKQHSVFTSIHKSQVSHFYKHNDQLPLAFGCSQLTVSRVPLSWWCVLKDDGHEGLPDGALPCLGHLTADAAVWSHLAGGGRGRRESLGIAGGHRRECVGVLPNKVAHSASDELEAVRIRAWGHEVEVSCGAHLQDLRQRDLLQEDTTVFKKRAHTSNKRAEIVGFHGVIYSYLVVFVGGVVLEQDDALTVQTPVVPLSLLGGLE